MNKKIILVHFSSAPGGIEVLMAEIISMFPDVTYAVFIIRPPVTSRANVYEKSKIQITYGSESNVIAALKLWRFAIKNRKNLFHVFNLGPFFLLVLHLAGVTRLVYSIHGTIHWLNSRQRIIRKAIWGIALSKRYRLIANSEYSREVFLSFINCQNHKIEVIYNPLYSDRLKLSIDKYENGGFNIIYAGRLAEGKNLFRWLDIAAGIHEVWLTARFFLYGDGPLKARLEDYSRQIGAEDYIKFKGYTPYLSKAYHEADLMLFLSEYESFGNVVVESILCGTPVIASDIPSTREIFKNYPGFLVPLDNNLELEVHKKINDIKELQSMIPQIMAEFKIRFSMEQHITKLRRIYDSFDV